LKEIKIYANFLTINNKESCMHTDENKKFDRRNIERNIKIGIINQKDYENYLLKLPDVSDKLFNPEKPSTESDEIMLKLEEVSQPKKKTGKKKSKGKGK
jgi:hypothetical protein